MHVIIDLCRTICLEECRVYFVSTQASYHGTRPTLSLEWVILSSGEKFPTWSYLGFIVIAL